MLAALLLAMIHAAAGCADWCTQFTTAYPECQMCRSTVEVKGGLYCAPWCQEQSCNSTLCKGCTQCASSGLKPNGLVPSDNTFVTVYDGKLMTAEDECLAPAYIKCDPDGQLCRVPQYCCDVPHMGYASVKAKFDAGDYNDDPKRPSGKTGLTPGNYLHNEPIQATKPLRDIFNEAGGNCVGLNLASLFSDPTGSVNLGGPARPDPFPPLPGTGQSGMGVRFYNSCDNGIPTVGQSCLMPDYPTPGWHPDQGLYGPGTDYLAITIQATHIGPGAGGCYCPPALAFNQPGCYYGGFFGPPDTRAIMINVDSCVPEAADKPYFPSYSASD